MGEQPRLGSIESEKDKVMSWFVYVLRCSDNSLYCGTTNDLDRRVEAQRAGTGARYTQSRLPLQLVWFSQKPNRSEAFREEYRIKRLPKYKKELLVASQQGRENYGVRVG